MGFKCRIVVSLLFVSPALVHAREVKYIDLAFVRATDRTTPSANAAAGLQKWQVHRGWYWPDGAPNQRDPRALGAYLLHVTRTEIHRAIRGRVQVLDTGREVDWTHGLLRCRFQRQDPCSWVGGYMSVLDFFRSAPVRIGMKAGFLSAVIYVALRYFFGC